MTNAVDASHGKGEVWWRRLPSSLKAAICQEYFDHDPPLLAEDIKKRNQAIANELGIHVSSVALQRQWYKRSRNDELPSAKKNVPAPAPKSKAKPKLEAFVPAVADAPLPKTPKTNKKPVYDTLAWSATGAVTEEPVRWPKFPTPESEEDEHVVRISVETADYAFSPDVPTEWSHPPLLLSPQPPERATTKEPSPDPPKPAANAEQPVTFVPRKWVARPPPPSVPAAAQSGPQLTPAAQAKSLPEHRGPARARNSDRPGYWPDPEDGLPDGVIIAIMSLYPKVTRLEEERRLPQQGKCKFPTKDNPIRFLCDNRPQDGLPYCKGCDPRRRKRKDKQASEEAPPKKPRKISGVMLRAVQ
jgi:hypothetical protein